MTTHSSTPSPCSLTAAHIVEGYARVVRTEGAAVWLEPVQTTSCGGCVSASMCGSKGLGSLASRIEARRFRLENPGGAELKVGERVVVGVDDSALIKASLIAYAIPLASALTLAALAQCAEADDATTMLLTFAGLLVGLIAMRIGARRLRARGELAPRFLRRDNADDTHRIA